MNRVPYPKATTDDAPSAGVPASPRLPDIERRVLDYWERDGTFRASIDNRPAGERGANEFVFYDGPPFANGLPHYGHLLTGYVKDIVPRYQTMRGKRVERRFGWDTHGLPAELEAMRQLGMTRRDDILDAGIDTFNDACRSSVLRYTDEWERYVSRQARWVDFDDDYRTLDLSYMESVMWAFKRLHDKGLAYEGYRCLPYCWNDETPLSAHELRMDDDVYRLREDPAVTVGVRLETGELALIWTTTPWTLPSNLAIAVGPDVEYVVVESEASGATERYVLAEARLAAYADALGEGAEGRVVARCKGADLVGRGYTPPFAYFHGHEGAHKVLAADYVTTDEGTGIVHLAPAFGEEDKQLTDQHGIAPVVPVAADGRFVAPVDDYAGLHVFDANERIVADLATGTRPEPAGRVNRGTVLLRHETYAHSYPHCWRCREPLIYMAVSSWFVATTKLRERMLELNDEITWVPEHVKHGQFGKWLENTRDWSISRNRFWGSPIPVWKSDDPAYPRVDVYGSLDELERDFGVRPDDLHRPAIDELTRPNPNDPTGKSTMRRVTDVLDCWFESGAMSFAQVHHPFENADWFEHHFPGDFIVEYIGQTRGWFYTLHVLATALFDRPAFSTCLTHGIVLGNDGEKMSKSLRNYPDVQEVFDRDGADAMRWFLMSGSIMRGGNLVVTEEGIRQGVRKALIPLWNAWHFFALYANARGDGGYEAERSTASGHLLDRYLLAKLRDLVEATSERMDAYDVSGACQAVADFVEVLTNWYIRRSRDRFWDTADGAASGHDEAFDTLHTALETLCHVAAPLLPLLTEEIWRGLTGGRSVHLEDWPDAETLPHDPELVEAMDLARSVCSTVLGLRTADGIRSRLPLRDLQVFVVDPERLAELAGVIADEVNVRSVSLRDVEGAAGAGLGVTRHLVVNPRAAGPRLGKQVQEVIAASKRGEWEQGADGTVTCAGVELADGEFAVETVVAGEGEGRAAAMLPGGGFVALDTTVDAELEREGLANDLIRVVQQARRDAGLDVSDRIELAIGGDAEVIEAARVHRDRIAAETLAEELAVRGSPDEGDRAVKVGNDSTARVEVARKAQPRPGHREARRPQPS